MKFGLLYWISALMLCGISHIVEDEAGGGAGDPGDEGEGEGDGAGNPGEGSIDDLDLDDDENPGEADLTPEERAAYREMLQDKAREEALSIASDDIKQRIPNFDMNKVVAGVRELAKTDKARAQRYVSSAEGLELYWQHHLANVETSDDVNSGSNGGGSSFEGILEKARGGDRQSRREALSRSKG